MLDLGDVQVIADVTINGKTAGRFVEAAVPRGCDAGSASGHQYIASASDYSINRMIADEQLPEDSDRNPNGTLKAWPQWLLDDSQARQGGRPLRHGACGRKPRTGSRLACLARSRFRSPVM